MKNDKLLKARQCLELTQLETARRANIAVRVYQKYENEGQTPNVKTAIRIADALETTVKELWGQ